MQRKKLNFTLIELLVVIVIMLILVGMLLPVISQVKKRSHVTTCRENLHQFGLAMASYRGDFEDQMPFWLSDLYGDYGVAKGVLICPQDFSAGHDGGRPGGVGDKYTSDQYGVDAGELEDKFPETDDTDRGQIAFGNTYWQPRSNEAKVEFCSYMYEFAAVTAQDWSYGGETVWWKMKKAQFDTDTMSNGKAIQAYEFPVVRCFYHWGVMWGSQNFIINTAMDGSTFINNDVWKDGRLD